MTNKRSATINYNQTDEMIISIGSLLEKMVNMFLSIFPSRHSRIAQERSGNSLNLPKFNFKFEKQNILKVIVPVIVLIVVGSVIFSVFNKKSDGPTVLSAQDTKDVKTDDIDRTFKFPLKDEKGKVTGNFSYVIKSAELRHKIVVKGATATSVPGRVFLIVNIKILNTLDQGLSINSRDFIRISVNGKSSEWFAPDIHNDPVEAQAISTTNTRVALAINDADKDIRLQIGEIGGKKEIVPINFE